MLFASQREEKVSLNSWFSFNEREGCQIYEYFKLDIQILSKERQVSHRKKSASGNFTITTKWWSL